MNFNVLSPLTKPFIGSTDEGWFSLLPEGHHSPVSQMGKLRPSKYKWLGKVTRSPAWQESWLKALFTVPLLGSAALGGLRTRFSLFLLGWPDSPWSGRFWDFCVPTWDPPAYVPKTLVPSHSLHHCFMGTAVLEICEDMHLICTSWS